MRGCSAPRRRRRGNLLVLPLCWWALPFAICFSAGTAVTAAAEISSPNLPFGDVNVVVVTDVHSWVGGHGGGDDDDDAADYGDVLSFYERLREHCRGAGRDLWFVMNGDWIDGTGLAMNGDISRLVPLLQKMPWDAVNVGNHELYRERVVQSMMQTSGWIEWWRPKYLSSNVLHAVSQEPIGNRYRVLRGKNWSVLTFGFLYNMDNAVGSVTVRKVEEAVEEEWFVSALENEQYDAIMVLSHMDVRDPSVATILSKIRSTVGSDNVPVQFVTGHTHIRDYDRPDAASASFEAGRYLDTVGFASFPARTSLAAATGAATDDDNASSSALFQYTYLDASVPVLADALGVSPLATENGLALSDFIKTVREEMGLTKVIGCLSQSYYLNRTLEDADSLWRFFRDTIVPEQFDENLALLLGKGGWRYDLLKGELRVDDLIAVSPFNDTFDVWSGVPAEVIVQLNETLNSKPPLFLPQLPEYIFATAETFVPMGRNYSLITVSFQRDNIQRALNNLTDSPMVPKILPGKTTTSIWLDYFQQQPEKCPTSKHKKPQHGKPQSSMPSKGFAGADPEADSLRLAFAVMAVAVIAVTGSVVVWQKGQLFGLVTAARESATMEALREYSDYDGEGDDEEEGEFV